MSTDSKKTRYMRINVWFNEESNKIHISAPHVPGFKVTTVNRNPESKRGHPHLYRKLAHFLRDQGAPAPVYLDDVDTKG